MVAVVALFEPISAHFSNLTLLLKKNFMAIAPLQFAPKTTHFAPNVCGLPQKVADCPYSERDILEGTSFAASKKQ